MKVIIAGPRDFEDYAEVVKAVEASGFEITEVVSGCARGVDKLGERWAHEHSIPVKQFPAHWTRYGKAAGQLRNKEMAAYAEGLVALWNGASKGPGGMIRIASTTGLAFFVHGIEGYHPT